MKPWKVVRQKGLDLETPDLLLRTGNIFTMDRLIGTMDDHTVT